MSSPPPSISADDSSCLPSICPSSLSGLTAVVSGASRGLGQGMAVSLARAGARVVILGKSTEDNANMPGTIYDTQRLIEAAGGRALAVKCDIRNEQEVDEAVAKTIKEFGSLDILINNASALYLQSIEAMSLKSFDVAHSVGHRGCFVLIKACLPHLKQSISPQILTISPPLNSQTPFWFEHLSCYASSKFAMSELTIAAAAQFRQYKIRCNTLWPTYPCFTAAVKKFKSIQEAQCRKSEFFIEAAMAVMSRIDAAVNGKCFLDESVMKALGMSEQTINSYNCDQTNGTPLAPDFFINGHEEFFRTQRWK